MKRFNLHFDKYPFEHREGENNPKLLANFSNCDLRTSGGNLIYGTAPVANEAWENSYDANTCGVRDDHFAICVGVNTDPNDWAGWCDGQKPFTRYLTDLQKRKMQEGKCLLALDSSLEGYHDEKLWPWFHQVMSESQLPIESLVFITGNYIAPQQYDDWCNKNNIDVRMKVIGHCHFEKSVGSKFIHGLSKPLTFEKHVDYKGNNETLTFNVLQKRPRLHRCWFYSTLKHEGFLTKGIFSMQEIPFDHPDDYEIEGKTYKYDLDFIRGELPWGPRNNEHDDWYYIERFNYDESLKTWVTVVSEASFFDSDQTLFVSEKTFKAIASRSPFVIFGNRGSLQTLKELGYKTFDRWWDESYDNLPTWERYDAVIRTMYQIDKIPDKMSMFTEMKEVLDYNYYNLMKNSCQPNNSWQEFSKYYLEYFTDVA